MADNEKGAPEAAPKSAKKGGFGGGTAMMIGVVAAVIVASALSAFLAVTLLGKGSGGAHAEVKEEAKKEEKGPGPTHDLGSFTVNLAGAQNGGFVKAGVVLELANAEMAEEVAARDPQIKDVVINALGERSMSEISSPEGRGAVKKKILDSVNKFLTKGKVNNVFFTEFVFQ